VKDQGICGSCWTFGTVGTLEGSYFLKYNKLVKFSEQELVDCVWPYGSIGCNGGEDWRAYSWIMSNGGLATADSYGPYLMADDFCRATSSSVNRQLKLSGYVNVSINDETALMDALVNHGPISVAIDASHSSLSFYSSGVYYEPECKNGPNDLDHAVLLVGYGTDATGGDYWIIKNSWSTHWGDQGYVKMSRKNNNCGVETSPTYAIIA
jgi:C1A family cysteine protease